MGSYYTLHHHPTRVEPLRAKKVFSVRENVYIFMKEQVYSARAQDGPRDIERNEAAPRHSWARQYAWQLLRFFPFPVGHPEHKHCTFTFFGR